jgi:hypothetical protein
MSCGAVCSYSFQIIEDQAQVQCRMVLELRGIAQLGDPMQPASIKVPASGTRLGTAGSALPPSQTPPRGTMVPTMASGLLAPLSGRRLDWISNSQTVVHCFDRQPTEHNVYLWIKKNTTYLGIRIMFSSIVLLIYTQKKMLKQNPFIY